MRKETAPPPSAHSMHLSTTYNIAINRRSFALIKSRKKTIELRLFNEERQKIKIGDKIKFTLKNKSLNAKVVGLSIAATFEQLCSIININDAGFQTKQELIYRTGEVCNLTEQLKDGVIGIHISVTR